MRVQNEGTGKSSWWMINPDAKPGKSVRRRAASMETSKFEKRRGRVKKKVEALRNGLTDPTSSPSSSVSEGLDMFPDSPLHSAGGFQLSPDFRPRASSNTSSCGRLSPIPAVIGLEPDWSPPSQFSRSNYSPEMSGNYSPDHLAGNLQQRMKIEPDYLGYLNGQSPQPQPAYTSAFEPFNRREVNTLQNPTGYTIQCPIHRFTNCNCPPVQCKLERMSPPPCMSPSYPHSNPSPEPLPSHPFILSNRIPLPGRPSSHSPPTTSQLPSNSQQGLQPTPSTMMGQLMGALNNSTLLDDLNINIESLHGGFDCNVDEVIKHELSMEGSLDFNFTGGHHQSMAPHQQEASNPQTSAPPPYSRSWVH